MHPLMYIQGVYIKIVASHIVSLQVRSLDYFTTLGKQALIFKWHNQ